MAGKTASTKPLTYIKIKNDSKNIKGNIAYKVRMAGKGWTGWKSWPPGWRSAPLTAPACAKTSSSSVISPSFGSFDSHAQQARVVPGRRL